MPTSALNSRPTTTALHHAEGLALRVSEWRSDSSDDAGHPAILFLNGIGGDARAAAPLLARFPDRCVVTIDMPGVVGSPDAMLPYSMAAMARAVMRIAADLGHGRVDLVGYSWGGALAQQIAASMPDAVRRLVLLATTAPGSAAGIGWAAPLDRDMWLMTARPMAVSPIGYSYQLLAISGWSMLAALDTAPSQPTLILMGQQDGVVPACHGDMLADRIRGARVERVPGAHLFPFTAAADTAQRIARFLDAA